MATNYGVGGIGPSALGVWLCDVASWCGHTHNELRGELAETYLADFKQPL